MITRATGPGKALSMRPTQAKQGHWPYPMTPTLLLPLLVSLLSSCPNCSLSDRTLFETFPLKAIAFYYYGMKKARTRFGVCIDCNPKDRHFEIVDAANRTDDGKNPPVCTHSIIRQGFTHNLKGTPLLAAIQSTWCS